MRNNDSHPIRNGIIATVIGGIVLSFWARFRDALVAAVLWIWEIIASFGTWLASTQDVYGWVLLGLFLLSVPAVLDLFSWVVRKKEPGVEDLYSSDRLFGADWHWSYQNGAIRNLWCLCPTCKSDLVYSEFVPGPFDYAEGLKEPKTDFICERCGTPRCTLPGDKRYALGRVEREIRRKIRSDEWRPPTLSD